MQSEWNTIQIMINILLLGGFIQLYTTVYSLIKQLDRQHEKAKEKIISNDKPPSSELPTSDDPGELRFKTWFF